MSNDDTLSESISNFASPFMTIPAQTLQDLLGTIQSLKDEVEQLKGIITPPTWELKYRPWKPHKTHRQFSNRANR